VLVCFVAIGGIVDHHCLNFLFIMLSLVNHFPVTCVSSYTNLNISFIKARFEDDLLRYLLINQIQFNDISNVKSVTFLPECS